MIGNCVEAIAQTVDLFESLDVLAITLPVRGRQRLALCSGKLFDLIQHIRLRFVLESNVACGDTTIQHLIKMIRIRMHENRLSGAAGRQRCNRGLGRHVLNGVHADAQMRQKRLRHDLAQFIIDRRCTGRHTVTTTIAAERAKEGAVRGTGVESMQTVDDVQPLLVRFECTDRLGKFCFRKRAAAVHPFWNTGLRIEALVLHEEDHTLWIRVTGGRSEETFGNERSTKCGTGGGCHSMQHFSTVEHDRSFNEMNGQVSSCRASAGAS